MSEFKDGDRVITVRDLPPISRGTLGQVIDASGIALLVRFDGDSSPGRLTPRDAVRKFARNAALAGIAAGAVIGAGVAALAASKRSGAKKAAARKAAPVQQPVTFGNPKITRAAGPTAPNTSITTEIAGQVVILFNDAVVDLQTNGPLAGAWAGTIVFQLGQPVAQDTRLTLDVRGAIQKSAGSAAVALIVLDGDLHARPYPGKKVLDTDFRWRITHTLRKGATTHTLNLFLGAERHSLTETVRIAIDAIDAVAR